VTTVCALAAFAANSVLCRLALRGGSIDAATFSAVRLVSGAAVLMLIAASTRPRRQCAGSWISAGWLLLYAIPFSFAYASLSTGTGALLLFGAVQVTMMVVAFSSGERPRFVQWCGFVLAMSGLVYLVLPGVSAPSPGGAALMMLAGASWGVYSLRGRGALNPIGQTTGNFVRAAPVAVVVFAFAHGSVRTSAGGLGLAVASGTLASALGYIAWYHALRGLTATRAAVVQLSVPVLAASAGVVMLGEALTTRLLTATVAVLAGVAMALLARDTVTERGTS